MLTKLKYAGVKIPKLLEIYKLRMRTCLEQCSVLYHSSLSIKQSNALDRLQAVCLKVILQENYHSYDSALLQTELDKLSTRRFSRCLSFSLKCLKHDQNKRIFPENTVPQDALPIRERENYKVNFGRTNAYKNSAVPFSHFREKEQKEAEGERRKRRGQG